MNLRVVRLYRLPSQDCMVVGYVIQASFLCTPFLSKKGKCSPFLELTPTPRQMPRDVTNISEDWADFCQCQEFWCHFLSFVFSGKWPFWLWEGALSLSKSPLKVKKGHSYEKMNALNDTKTPGTVKICGRQRGIFVIVCGICQSEDKKQISKCQYRPKNHANVAQK